MINPRSILISKRRPYPRYVLYLFVLVGVMLTACEESATPADDTTDTPYVINLEYQGVITKETTLPITLYVESDSQNNGYAGKAKRRGGSSIVFPKHSFSVDLKKDVSLGGLPADDDWILNANYIDKTFLRHVVSYELYEAMGSENIASSCQYVDLKLNDTYNGLYVLMEKLDKSSLKIDGDDEGAMIFKEPHVFRKSYDGVVPQDPDNFHQQTYPKLKKKDMRSEIEALRSFILNSTDQNFRDRFHTYLSLESIVDWHLLLWITNNSDGILKNFYLYKMGSNTAFRIAPWDYDHSFGRDGDNELNIDTRPMMIERSILFERLLQSPWYTSKLKQRWLELNEKGLFSTQGLKERIRNKASLVRASVQRNAQLWPIDSEHYFDANSFEEELEIMYQFIDRRHSRVVGYIDKL